MRSDSKIFADVILKSSISVFCCLVLEFILYGWKEFDVRYSNFQLTALAISGSLFFFTLRVNRRNAFAVLLVLLVLEVGFLRRSLTFVDLVWDLTFNIAIAGALYLFFTQFYLKTVGLRYVHSLVLASSFALSFIVVGIFNILVGRAYTLFPLSFLLRGEQAKIINAFIAGLGIGIGILILDNGYVQMIRKSFEHLVGILRSSFRDFGDRI